MPNLTAQPPPQLSDDGLWRWDGSQWTLVKPKTSKPSYLPGPSTPQVSPDGRWWWVGYQWVPADPASPKPPQPGMPPGRTPAKLAFIFGLVALGLLPFTLFTIMQGRYDANGLNVPYSLSDVVVILALHLAVAVAGVVFGVRALLSRKQRDARSSQRRMAWGGIAASLVSAAGVVLLGLAVAAGS